MNARACIKNPEALVAWRRQTAGTGPVAVVSGTFDLFQPGNLQAVQVARRVAPVVIVVVEPHDVAAAHVSAGRPQNTLETRVEMAAHLRDVAAVTSLVPGKEREFFQGLRPFVWVTAATQKASDPYAGLLSGLAGHIEAIAPLQGCFTEDIIKAMADHQTPVGLPAGCSEMDDPPPGKGTLVSANGCFDILHVGHLRFLEDARALGDSLTVLINSDESVARYKGPTRPVFPACFRVMALRALKSVDAVVVFPGDNPLEEIRRLKPMIHVKGGSYEPDRVRQEKELVEGWGGRLVCTPMVDGFSTTAFIKKALTSSILSEDLSKEYDIIP